MKTLALKVALTPEALPEPLRGQKILEVDSATFQYGCLYVHEFETRLQNIVKKCCEAKAILFLDQLHLAVKAGALSSHEERTIATLLTPALARREISLIGATTPAGYRAIVRHNPPIRGVFHPVGGDRVENEPQGPWQRSRCSLSTSMAENEGTEVDEGAGSTP